MLLLGDTDYCACSSSLYTAKCLPSIIIGHQCRHQWQLGAQLPSNGGRPQANPIRNTENPTNQMNGQSFYFNTLYPTVYSLDRNLVLAATTKQEPGEEADYHQHCNRGKSPVTKSLWLWWLGTC